MAAPGGPLVCRAAQVVLGRINDAQMLTEVRGKGQYLCDALQSLASPLVREVRGKGLLVGVELDCEVRPLLQAARQRGLLVINAGDNVLRLCPPLTIDRQQLDEAVGILGDCLSGLEASHE